MVLVFSNRCPTSLILRLFCLFDHFSSIFPSRTLCISTITPSPRTATPPHQPLLHSRSFTLNLQLLHWPRRLNPGSSGAGSTSSCSPVSDTAWVWETCGGFRTSVTAMEEVSGRHARTHADVSETFECWFAWVKSSVYALGCAPCHYYSTLIRTLPGYGRQPQSQCQDWGTKKNPSLIRSCDVPCVFHRFRSSADASKHVGAWLTVKQSTCLYRSSPGEHHRRYYLPRPVALPLPSQVSSSSLTSSCSSSLVSPCFSWSWVWASTVQLDPSWCGNAAPYWKVVKTRDFGWFPLNNFLYFPVCISHIFWHSQMFNQ